MEIDILIAERALRGAAMYSLIGTARLNGLNPAAYPACVLERIADHPVSRTDASLPWNVVQPLPDSANIEPIR